MTLRLSDLADQNWARFDGWSASQGMDPLDLPWDRFLSLVYFWATQNMEEEDLEKFDTQLWMPPKGEAVEQGPWSPEAETSAFKTLSAQVNGREATRSTVSD